MSCPDDFHEIIRAFRNAHKNPRPSDSPPSVDLRAYFGYGVPRRDGKGKRFSLDGLKK